MENHHSVHLEPGESVTVRLKEQCREFIIQRSQANGSGYRVKLQDIDTTEQASQLQGGELVIASRDRVRLPTDEYYIDDLIGCAAIADDGTELGFIDSVISHQHHDLWVINGPKGEILVPAVKEFIVEVDLEAHRVIIRAMEGLWDA